MPVPVTDMIVSTAEDGVVAETTAVKDPNLAMAQSDVNNVLLEIISRFSGATYAGVATPETDPGTPLLKVFYLTTTAGEYANFGNLTVESGKLTVLLYNGSAWEKQVLDLPTSGGVSTINVVQTTGTSTADVMSQKSVTDELDKRQLKPSTEGMAGQVLTKTGPNAKDVSWQTPSGSGGTSVIVVQATGESTTDVMSQDAVTKFVDTSNAAIYSIFSSVPIPSGNPLDLIVDMSIKNRVENRMYWIQVKSTQADKQQLTIFFTKTESPRTYTGYVNIKDISVIDAGVHKYSVTDVDGEEITMIVDWSKLSVGYQYNYYPDEYILKDQIFYGGILANKMINTDTSLSQAGVPADAEAVGKQLAYQTVLKDVSLSLTGLIWRNTENGHQAGDFAVSDGYNSSDFIDIENVEELVFKLRINSETVAHVSYYDEGKIFISALGGYFTDNTERSIGKADFPDGAKYIRFCTTTGGTFDKYAKVAILTAPKVIMENIDPTLTMPNKIADAKVVGDRLSILEDMAGSQSYKYWAVCGDSITNANHMKRVEGERVFCIDEILDDDPFCPIDGYANLNSYKRKNYAYYVSKKHNIRWANYGWGGTTLHDVALPIGDTSDTAPFVNERIENLKEGVSWDYITIFFGWNDFSLGIRSKKEAWLKEQYGSDIAYPLSDSQIGTEGYATEEQKSACDAQGDLYFNQVLGTVEDNDKTTFLGAYNYALEYLLRKYPNAKIMIVAPWFNSNQDALSDAVKAMADKWGVICLDFRDIPYWYSKEAHEAISFPNQEAESGGYWTTENGTTLNPTLDGFNMSRYSSDSLHPSNLGYQMMAGPFEKLIFG